MSKQTKWDRLLTATGNTKESLDSWVSPTGGDGKVIDTITQDDIAGMVATTKVLCLLSATSLLNGDVVSATTYMEADQFIKRIAIIISEEKGII